MLLLTLVFCLGCCGSTTVQTWQAPAAPPAGTLGETPYAAIHTAFHRSDCSAVVSQTETLWAEIQEQFRSARESETGSNSAAIRGFLDQWVNSSPPVVMIGEIGFERPRWWADAYDFCLVSVGRLDDAALDYQSRLFLEFDADVAWRLAITQYWRGESESARTILENWPEDADVPIGFEEVLALMKENGVLSSSIQLEAGSSE